MVAKEFLSITETAKFLGIGKRTVHDLLYRSERPIPYYRIGRKIIRIRKDELIQWLEENRQKRNSNEK